LAALGAVRQLAAERGLELRPVAVAGHSVGELAAMAAVAVFDTPTVLRLVVARARAMEAACAGLDGGMTAILGLDAAAAEAACASGRAESGEQVAVANYNAPDQFVIAGTAAGLAATAQAAQRLGAKRLVPLKVAGPFHTALMADAAAAFAPYVRRAEIRPATAPVILNVSAQPATEPHALRAELEQHIAAPVRWSQGVARSAELGVDAFLELGPGQVLSGLAKRQAKGVPTLSVQDTAGIGPALDVLARLAAEAPRAG
jgi:[acyl-carrier-protein] S-malonyltransferase